MVQVEVADKGTHQAGFAHASGQGKAQGWKFTLKARDRGKLALDGAKQAGCIGIFAGRRDLGDAMEKFQGDALGWPQAQSAGYGVNVSVHRLDFLLGVQAGA